MGRRKGEITKLGKSALIKDRFRGKKKIASETGGFLHTTELQDDSDYVGNITSITDQNSLDDFLTTAELAGRDFTAQRTNVQIVSGKTNPGLMSAEELKKVRSFQQQHESLLRIPRRPAWTEATTADKLQQDENLSFLDWRRQLGQLQEKEHIYITPYEKNLEFWRQLWRVIERSDVVVQIVDARNPLLFYCADLEDYVKEVDPDKQSLLLVNKADLLTDRQRQAWAEYFTAKGIKAIFWSAAQEMAKLEAEKEKEEEKSDVASRGVQEKEEDEEDDGKTEDDDNDNNLFGAVGGDDEDGEGNDDDDDKEEADDEQEEAYDERQDSTKNNMAESLTVQQTVGAGNSSSRIETKDGGSDNALETRSSAGENRDSEKTEEHQGHVESFSQSVDHTDKGATEDRNVDDHDEENDDDEEKTENKEVNLEGASAAKDVEEVSGALRSGEELLQLFRQAAKMHYTSDVTTVGMVGYPNVGKSSTINAILKTKKVPVSATPGRTKHFQTLFVEKDILLCDCPGLVFPSFVNSKSDLVVNGILPIDQLQDSESPISLVCDRIERDALQAMYSINLPPPEEWEDPNKPTSAYDLLQAYGSLRGFMTHKGNVDHPRAARLILKDYVNGRLLFCLPPPGIEEKAFQKPPYTDRKEFVIPHHLTALKTESQKKQEALDKEFFAQRKTKAHEQGPHTIKAEKVQQGAGEPKPWKKHHNKNKREKLRRVYADLDRHL